MKDKRRLKVWTAFKTFLLKVYIVDSELLNIFEGPFQSVWLISLVNDCLL